MASSILQGVVSPNVGQGLINAFAGGQDIYNTNQAAQLNRQSAQQRLSENDYQTALRKMQVANNLAKKALTLPPEQRGQLLADSSGALQSLGFTPDDLANTPLDDQGLQNLIAQTDSALQASGAQANQQFGAQETLKDEQGNLFFATSKRDPSTGKVAGVVAAADGSNKQPVGRLSVTGAYGQTATERVGQIGAETGARTQAAQDVRMETEPQLQAEIERQKQSAKMAETARADAIKTGNKYDALLAGFEEAKAIIPISTGSTLGGIRDTAGRIIGYSNDAAQNTARLKSLAAWLVTQVPKPGGAVSDADLAQFKKAVGEIDDNTPPEERMAAVDTAMNMIQKWQGVVGSGAAQGGSGAGAMTPGIFTSKSGIQFEVK